MIIIKICDLHHFSVLLMHILAIFGDFALKIKLSSVTFAHSVMSPSLTPLVYNLDNVWL